MTLEVPARVVNLPDNEALALPAPDTIEYVVSGEAISILPFYYNRPTVSIDAAADEVDFEISGGAFPMSIRVESATPRRYVPVRERRVSAVVPIELRADFDLPATHAFVVQPRLQPDSVRISGAVSVIRRIDRWPTKRIAVDNILDSILVDVPLSDSLHGIVSLSRASTRMFARTAEFTRGVRDIDVRLAGSPANRPMATLDPSRVRVSFRVRVDDYNRAMSSSEFHAVVPYDVIRGDTTGRVTPMLSFPPDVLVLDATLTPPTLRYFNVLYDQ